MTKTVAPRKPTQGANPSRVIHGPSRPEGRVAPMHPLLRLQQFIGNRAVGQLIHAKPQIGRPEDAYEQEADRVNWATEAHVVQQNGEGGGAILVGPLDDPAEREARTVSEKVLTGDTPLAAMSHAAPWTAQRQTPEDQVDVDEEEETDERHTTPVATESHAPVLHRQGRDIPPPPPPYPHFSQMFTG